MGRRRKRARTDGSSPPHRNAVRMDQCVSLFRIAATVLVLLTGLVLPLGELRDNAPLKMLGQSLVASAAPSVFLYSDRLQFDLVIESQQPDKEIVIAGNAGIQERISGPFWRKAVYLNAFHHHREDVLNYAFFGGGDLGKDLGIQGTVKRVVLRQWDADVTPLNKTVVYDVYSGS